MTQPYIGQIQPFAFNFAPKNWAFCNGQILAVQQNPALYALRGTTYGGNGSTTFALPNLQSRVPMHFGTSNSETFVIGQESGTESVTLLYSSMPAHNHGFMGSSIAGADTQPDPDCILASVGNPRGAASPYYADDTTPQPLNPQAIGFAGGNQAHNNLQPYLTINWCICQYGVYPSRN